MNNLHIPDILDVLDRERRALGPAEGLGGLVREWAPDRSECRIVFSHCTTDELAGVIRDEQARASAEGYALEWKTYGHDGPTGLADALADAGFEADDEETVLVLELGEPALAVFDQAAAGLPGLEIRAVRDRAGLADVAAVSRQIGRRNVEAETERLAALLDGAAEKVSIHVAYLDGEPASCGRLHYGRTPGVAELAGGRTVTTHRNKGLFTALVGSRLREAAEAGGRYVFVDALPTSEPILVKRGFNPVTSTRPFTYED
ncbi:MAG TPA: hypothetical protein VGX23_25905 [Actinocrinis sp.]|nr:hypothetical protein [Actinocrinis sp.]